MECVSVLFVVFLIMLGLFIYYCTKEEKFATKNAPLMFEPQLRHKRYRKQEISSADEIMYGYRIPPQKRCFFPNKK